MPMIEKVLRPLALAAMCLASIAACSDSSSAVGSDFCSKLSDFSKQCGPTNACLQADAKNCASLQTRYSAPYLSAMNACLKPPYDCGEGGNLRTVTTCLNLQLSGTTPTVAQAQVKTDFCQRCPDDPKSPFGLACSQFFQVSPDGSAGNVGEIVLFSSDALADQMDQQCAKASADAGGIDCASTFFLCTLSVFNAAPPILGACRADSGP
jgi:hypothetical protein